MIYLQNIGRYFLMIKKMFQKPTKWSVMKHLILKDIEGVGMIFLDDKEVGIFGSLARHYELGPIALAVVKRNVALDATLICEGVTATQEELALR